jgi:hypothetical protein
MDDILGIIIQLPGYAGILIGFNKYAKGFDTIIQ